MDSQVASEPRDESTLSSGSELTFWERVAETRWGKYITQAELDALRFACSATGGPGAFLEVGCEGGRWSALAASWGWSPTCVDVDSKALAACQARLPHARCIVTFPEKEELPCPDASMRLVMCIEVFAVADSPWFPHEAFRVLEPGGVVMSVTLNRSSLRSLASRALGRDKYDQPPYYRRSYRAVRRDFLQAGFRILLERGLCWAPFTRRSHSPLIPACLAVERSFRLQKVVRWSPWVILVAGKPK